MKRSRRGAGEEQPGAHSLLPGWTGARSSAPPPLHHLHHLHGLNKNTTSSSFFFFTSSFLFLLSEILLLTLSSCAPEPREFAAHGSACARLVSGRDVSAVSARGAAVCFKAGDSHVSKCFFISFSVNMNSDLKH